VSVDFSKMFNDTKHRTRPLRESRAFSKYKISHGSS